MMNWPKIILKFIKMLLPKLGNSFKGIWNRIKKVIVKVFKGMLSKLIGCDKKKEPINPVNSNNPPLKTKLSDFVNYNKKEGFLTGIDIHDTNTKINWDDVKASGVSFTYIKATEGASYPEGYHTFSDQWINAKKHNIIRGAFFYYSTNLDKDTPENQANNFISTVQKVTSKSEMKLDLPPVLDIENVDFGKRGMTMEKLRKDLVIWLQLIEAQFKKSPIIYSNRYYYNKILDTEALRKYRTWIADPKPDSKGEPKMPWTFWQNVMNITVPSITGEIDLNRFKGSLSDLKEL